MNFPGVMQGYSILQTSQKMANEASSSLASQSNQSPLNELEASKKEQKPDPINDLIQLKNAESYNQVGANVVHRTDEMIGTTLDIMA
ncbi:hypothetical protein AB4391_01435 [Vibrio lentus]|uniref:Uncharacterized protein n=1 Tax=Vibrio lentus TaxID=136468 RepID=A0A2N7K1L3_9VIBR|nr:hypothetical protein [Vibrio lentus]PMM67184.1 hypothetical protein BCT49_10490 [Vibrio lentus]